jgi:hypothetical protein
MNCQRPIERDTVMGAKSSRGRSIRASGSSPRKQAEDMTAPEMFTKARENS